MSGRKFFPPFLDSGSKGPAVAVLQALLKQAGYNSTAIIVDGWYGPETEKGVRELQRTIGVEVDGHFGPVTRAAWTKSGGVDVDEISEDAFTGESIYWDGENRQ